MIGERDPWERITTKLGDMEEKEGAHILQGRPKTIEDYRESVGYLKAVAEIRAELDEIRKPHTYSAFGGRE